MGRQKQMLFGAGAGLVLVVGTGVWLKSKLFPPDVRPCSERYASRLAFPQVEAGAQKISLREIQSRLDFTEWGLIESVSVAQLADAPAPFVLEVRLPEGSGDPAVPGTGMGGMGFRWKSSIPGGTQAACLSYSVFLAEDFEFGLGGRLPGLMGGDPPAAGKPQNSTNGFSARLMWREGGLGEVLAGTPGRNPDGESIQRGAWRFPRGRWVRLEQEVVINGQGANGILRVWADGTNVIDRRDMVFAVTDRVKVSGVAADVHYAGTKTKDHVAPKDTFLRITPLELRW